MCIAAACKAAGKAGGKTSHLQKERDKFLQGRGLLDEQKQAAAKERVRARPSCRRRRRRRCCTAAAAVAAAAAAFFVSEHASWPELTLAA